MCRAVARLDFWSQCLIMEIAKALVGYFDHVPFFVPFSVTVWVVGSRVLKSHKLDEIVKRDFGVFSIFSSYSRQHKYTHVSCSHASPTMPTSSLQMYCNRETKGKVTKILLKKRSTC